MYRLCNSRRSPVISSKSPNLAPTQLPGWAGPPPSSPRVAPSRTPAAMRRSSGTLAAPKAPTAGFGGAVAGGSSRLGLQGIFCEKTCPRKILPSELKHTDCFGAKAPTGCMGDISPLVRTKLVFVDAVSGPVHGNEFRWVAGGYDRGSACWLVSQPDELTALARQCRYLAPCTLCVTEGVTEVRL